MALFTPKGDRSQRVIVAELAAGAAYGDVLSFEALREALGVPAGPDDAVRASVRQAVSGARRKLLQDHCRALVAVRGQGYRVARPGEFAGIAQDYRERSDRALHSALSYIECAPTDDMTPAERKRHEAYGVVLRNLNARVGHAEERLGAIEKVLGIGARKTVPGTVEEP